MLTYARGLGWSASLPKMRWFDMELVLNDALEDPAHRAPLWRIDGFEIR
jgi:hypothetical protein